MRIISANEVANLPVGSIVYLRKDGYWLAGQYRVRMMHGLKYLEGVHSKRMLSINNKKLYHYELP